MNENPFQPPESKSPLAVGRTQYLKNLVVWVSVVVLAMLAALSSFKIPWDKDPYPSVAVFTFWLAPPLAILIVIASREMQLRKLSHGKAIYNALGFCLYCIGFLIIGYGMFLPTCTGSFFGIASLTGSVLYNPEEDSLIAFSTLLATIIACVAMLWLHKLVRPNPT